MIRVHDFQRWLLWSILGVSFLTALIVFTGILPGVRLVLVLVFFVTCPGLPFVRLLRLQDFLTELVLMIALSLVIDATIAMILLYTKTWSYITGLLVLIGISLAGVGLNFRQRRQAAEPAKSLDMPWKRSLKLTQIAAYPVIALKRVKQVIEIPKAQPETSPASLFSIPEIPKAEKLFELPLQAQGALESEPVKRTRRRSRKAGKKVEAIQVFETPAEAIPAVQLVQGVQPEPEVKPGRSARRRSKKAANPENPSQTKEVENQPDEVQTIQPQPRRQRRTKKKIADPQDPPADGMADAPQAGPPVQPATNEQANPVEDPSIPEQIPPTRRRRSRKARPEDQP